MPDLSADDSTFTDPKRRPLQLAKNAGLFRLGLAAQRRKNPLLILCYHGVSKSNEHEWNPELYMPPSRFRRRLEKIGQFGYDVKPLDWAITQARSGGLKRPTIAITFDDGWHDFYSEAWPVLREFGYPATIYQTTFYSNFNRPVFDTTVPYLLWSAKGGVLADSHLTGSAQPIRLTSLQAIRQASDQLKSRARQLALSAEEKDGMLKRLSAALSIDFSQLLHNRVLHLMNPAEIAEVSRAGIDIQLHTHTHRMPREKENFLREIDRNRTLIEGATRKPAVHFCYPNGWHRPELGAWLRAANVKTATTCDPGMVSSSSNPLYLPRLTDSCCVSDVRFESWLSGIGLVGSWCKRWLKADSSWPSKTAAARAAMEDTWSDEPDPEPAVGGEWAARAAGRG